MRYDFGNHDDLDKAIDGLGRFCHNWCQNCEESDKQNDLVFRCGECEFLQNDSRCAVKTFLLAKGTKEQADKAMCMGFL